MSLINDAYRYHRECEDARRDIASSPRLRPTLHCDGSVTYWSVYQQVWISRASRISDRELAAMPTDERSQVIAHLSGASSHE